MFVLHLECAASESESLVAELWERGTAGVTEEDAPAARVHLAAFFERPFDAAPFAALAPRWEQIEERDWIAVSRSQWEPVLAGRRFYLAPEWSREPTPPGRLRLEMRPGQACGTGWHAATQLCLEAMETCPIPGAAVLDLGTGSGLLAVAAALLGAARIYACDIDCAALAHAAARLRAEGVSASLFAGSVRSLRDAAVDVAIANIDAETLVELAPELLRVRRPAGRLVLSGFPVRDLDRVRAAYGRPFARLEKDGWIALIF